MSARDWTVTGDAAAARKLKRITAGHSPRVLDLFSGCGGISLGFRRVGFEVVGGVESDQLAARSHAFNFHRGDSSHCKARDISRTDPALLCSDFGLGPVGDAVDVIVGGPPCQAYARIGRAKLRDVAEHPEAFRVDPRGNLYLRYLAYVRELRPLALLIENVPDVLRYGGQNIMQEIVNALKGYGYEARYSLINSAFHGVPQMRDRVYLIAFMRELGCAPSFPKASHHMKLPVGYRSTRAVALRNIDLLAGAGYIEADEGDASLPHSITAEEAIGDLPTIRGDSVKRGARRFSTSTFLPYRPDSKVSSYAQSMRCWPGFESNGGIMDHAIRFLPRDGATFAAMPEGAEYPQARRVAAEICKERARQLRIEEGSDAWSDIERRMVPPYDPSKFPNRWWKLCRDGPVRTITAHLSNDTYSHIHWDPSQARTISVREAARLQSFPDGFHFEGTMNPAFRQIGNAVPPLMAARLAECILDGLKMSATRFGGAITCRTTMS